MLLFEAWPSAGRLAITVRVDQSAHPSLHEDKCGNKTQVFKGLSTDIVVLVAQRHRIYLAPRKTTPAAVALWGHFVGDARDRVFGNDHPMPPVDHATATPDPHNVVRLKSCGLIEASPSPILGCAAYGQ